MVATASSADRRLKKYAKSVIPTIPRISAKTSASIGAIMPRGKGRENRVRSMRASTWRSRYWFKALAEPAESAKPNKASANRSGRWRRLPS